MWFLINVGSGLIEIFSILSLNINNDLKSLWVIILLYIRKSFNPPVNPTILLSCCVISSLSVFKPPIYNLSVSKSGLSV